MNDLKIFLLGFTQMIFLSAMTYFISVKNYPAMGTTCFLTNLFFLFAVSILKTKDTLVSKILYSVGCSIGCLIGVYIASIMQLKYS